MVKALFLIACFALGFNIQPAMIIDDSHQSSQTANESPNCFSEIVIYPGSHFHLKFVAGTTKEIKIGDGFSQLTDALGAPSAIKRDLQQPIFYLKYEEEKISVITDADYKTLAIITFNEVASTDKGIKIGDTFVAMAGVYGYDGLEDTYFQGVRMSFYRKIGIVFMGQVLEKQQSKISYIAVSSPRSPKEVEE